MKHIKNYETAVTLENLDKYVEVIRHEFKLPKTSFIHIFKRNNEINFYFTVKTGISEKDLTRYKNIINDDNVNYFIKNATSELNISFLNLQQSFLDKLEIIFQETKYNL
jgi:hypothetical protein